MVAVFFLHSATAAAKNPLQMQANPNKDSLWLCRDAWLGLDKVKHLSLSCISTIFIARHIQIAQNSPLAKGRAIGAAVTLNLGVLKEWRDHKRPANHFCWKDLTANLLGVGFGIILTNFP